jgi:L-ascorbate metabolism protein UlaG (beta-lactamase superfamily)
MWGDNKPVPSEKALSMIGDVDVVFVPVDGSKHILDYNQADSVVASVKANIAIPHHYLVKETTFVTSTLFPALEWAQTHENTLLDAATVTINKKVLKGKDGHVYYFGSNQLGSTGSKN